MNVIKWYKWDALDKILNKIYISHASVMHFFYSLTYFNLMIFELLFKIIIF